jgi:hypothetical protein
MQSLKAVKFEDLKGGVSTTFTVTLEDGSKAVFRSTERYGKAEHDVGAFEVAALVGMDDIVPAAAVRTLDTPYGKMRGALCEWQEGEKTSHLLFDDMYGESLHDERRAALFDWVIGNRDRHEGNWVVDDGQIRLIDHNLTFDDDVYSGMLTHLWENDAVSEPEFKALAKPYIDNLAKIRTRLVDIGVDEWRIASLEARVRRLSSISNWKELRNAHTATRSW